MFINLPVELKYSLRAAVYHNWNWIHFQFIFIYIRSKAHLVNINLLLVALIKTLNVATLKNMIYADFQKNEWMSITNQYAHITLTKITFLVKFFSIQFNSI